MKCNQCGGENADTAAFCSHCGAVLQSGTTAPMGNQTISSIASTPVSTPATSAKNKTPLIIAVAIAILALCGGIAAAIILLVGGKTTTYACSKEGEIMTSSIAATFKRDKVKKLEYTLILEDAGSLNSRSYNSSSSDDGNYSFSVNDDGSYHFSYSGPGTITSVTTPDDDDWDYYGYGNSSSSYNYGSSSSANSEEMMEILALSLVFASFEQYADDPGVDYYESDRGSIATYSVTIDIDKLSSKTKDSIFDDDDLGLETTPEMFQKGFTSMGYACKEKK